MMQRRNLPDGFLNLPGISKSTAPSLPSHPLPKVDRQASLVTLFTESRCEMVRLFSLMVVLVLAPAMISLAAADVRGADPSETSRSTQSVEADPLGALSAALPLEDHETPASSFAAVVASASDWASLTGQWLRGQRYLVLILVFLLVVVFERS